MLIGALIAFVPAIFGIALLAGWYHAQAKQFEHAEVRHLRSREAWQAVAELEDERIAA
jgi:hypothetical protein